MKGNVRDIYTIFDGTISEGCAWLDEDDRRSPRELLE